MDEKLDEPVVREKFIITAVNFLTNPTVQQSTLQQKQRFLRNKGLTEREIQIACERAGVFTGASRRLSVPTTTTTNERLAEDRMSQLPQSHQIDINYGPNDSRVVWKQSTFGRIKEILNSIVVFSGAAYLIFKFYKRFIEPWLFGGRKKSVEAKIDQLTIKVETDMKTIGQDVARIREDLDQINGFDVKRELQNFKSDLDSIKGLLLNKKQFASPNLRVVAPSIPAWQLDARPRRDSENDKNDDAASGSGSSETEVVTKNSDSSLEIM